MQESQTLGLFKANSKPLSFIISGNPEEDMEWHVTGGHKPCGNKNESKFSKLCREKLPYRDLPIRVGDTGYINCDKSILSGENCWCKDSFGRMAIILNGKFMFQRYMEGDDWRVSENGSHSFDVVTQEELINFTAQLSQ